jgi:hypothetical protein
MQLQTRTRSEGTSPRSFMPAQAGLLQRKCACGGAPGVAGPCEECSNNQLTPQRRAADRVDASVPLIVHEVLRSPGLPLDPQTRAFMEPRFGHDFSRVRVHTDARAAESAAAVNSLAYTVGSSVVFGHGMYEPQTGQGQRLLAHELTHVLQQSTAGASASEGLKLGAPHDQAEREADGSSSVVDAGRSIGIPSQSSDRLQRQTAPRTPAKPAEKTAEKTPTVGNCPLPSDFKDDNEAGMNMMCVSNAASKMAPSCNLTDKHFELINAAKEPARKRAEKANSRMAWLGGPEYAQRIGARVFKGTPPDAKTIKDTLGKMVQILGGKSLRFNGATCADPLCESKGEHAAAYESGPTEPVTLCPRSFLANYLPKLPRTIIHEAVHLSGIDINPNIEERYCDQKGCGEPCQDATSADAWALFIDCIGGPLIKPQTEKPAYSPRIDFDTKIVSTVEKEFGR